MMQDILEQVNMSSDSLLSVPTTSHSGSTSTSTSTTSFVTDSEIDFGVRPNRSLTEQRREESQQQEFRAIKVI